MLLKGRHYTLNFQQQHHCREEPYLHRVISWLQLEEFAPFIVQPLGSIPVGYVMMGTCSGWVSQCVGALMQLARWIILIIVEQSEHVQQVKSPTSQPSAANVCFYVFVPAVPTLPKTRCQQASDHAAATEAIQEPHHPGLQDSGTGTYQHGRGNWLLQHWTATLGWKCEKCLHLLFLSVDLIKLLLQLVTHFLTGKMYCTVNILYLDVLSAQGNNKTHFHCCLLFKVCKAYV